MNMDNSIASFWHSYSAAEKATKLLAGRAMTFASDPVADAGLADGDLDSTLLEVLEHHP